MARYGDLAEIKSLEAHIAELEAEVTRLCEVLHYDEAMQRVVEAARGCEEEAGAWPRSPYAKYVSNTLGPPLRALDEQENQGG